MNPTPKTVRIRRMTPTDLDRVIEIAGILKDAPQWPRSAYLAVLDPKAAPPRTAMVAENWLGVGAPGGESSSRTQGAVAGFAVASLLPPLAELETIAVDLPFQRRGLARRLFAALASELAAAQVTEIMLEVRASNLPAHGLYRQLGFVETGRRTRYYHDPAEDAVLMHLRL